MARLAPKKLTPEQKERLRDPRFAVALRATKSLRRANKKK